MSVLMEFSMFPTDKGESVSQYVSKVIENIKNNTKNYKLTAMGTIVETENFEQALEILQKSHDILSPISSRIFSTVKFDIRKNSDDRLNSKIKSIESKIGIVNK